jgi:hypothetical protein
MITSLALSQLTDSIWKFFANQKYRSNTVKRGEIILAFLRTRGDPNGGHLEREFLTMMERSNLHDD